MAFVSPMAQTKLQQANSKRPKIATTNNAEGAVYRIRAMEMLTMSIQGFSRAEIAEKFRCSVDTVYNCLNWAVRQGLAQQYENEIIGALAPMAIEIYKEKMKNDRDGYVAKDVLDKLVKLGERFEFREAAVEQIGLKGYIAQKNAEREQREDTKNAGSGSTIDAETAGIKIVGPVPPTTAPVATKDHDDSVAENSSN